MKDTVLEDMNIIIERQKKSYNLNEKETEELKIATTNYDYEANEGVIITKRDDVVSLFTEPDYETRIEPTQDQIKALTEYIKETEKYYTFGGFREETDEVLMSILNETPKKKNIERGR